MVHFVSFLKAASDVARANELRSKNRYALIRPLASALISQGVQEAVSDANVLLLALNAPKIPQEIPDKVVTTASTILNGYLSASERANSAASQFLDRLYRSCSES